MTTGAPVNSALEALVLAAGKGSRFGGGKLTAPWLGGVLIDGALAAAFAAPVRTVTVVWGADEAVSEAAQAFAERTGQAGQLRIVHAERFAEGLSESLKAGVASLPPDTEGLYVFLGDMPQVPPSIPPLLEEALRNGAQAAAPIFNGVRGHPALIGAGLLSRLSGLTGDRGAGALLDGLGSALALVETADDGVVWDVDLPNDLRR